MISKHAVVVMGLAAFLASGAGRPVSVSPGETPDATLERAAAALLEGRTDEARRQADQLPPEACQHPPQANGYDPKREAAEQLALRCLLLRAALDSSGRDPFPLLTEILEAGSSIGDEGNPLASAAWARLFAREAAGAGYKPMALYVLREVSDRLAWQAQAKHLSRAERTEAESQKPVVDRDLEALAPAAASGSTPATAGADPVATRIAALLARPRLDLFRESKLPPGMKSSPTDAGPSIDDADEETQDGADPSTAASPAPGKPGLPPHFAAVRVERQGTEAAAIGLSQDYDPVGEISRGAYWVVRSHDGGATWGPRLYTGLRIEAPYVVHPASALPLLAEDHLDVEVSIRDLDEESITFPPVALKAKRKQDGLRLAIPFTDLERDSDGDGLTDLAEERLVTDPANPDTDGDGLTDANDSLPQVPWSAVMDDESAALAATLERIGAAKSMAIIHEVGPSGRSLDEFMATMRRATLSDERTTFLVAERAPFRSLVLSQRAIVLTPHELEAARRKFGAMLPLQLQLFVLDRARQTGYVIWDASWVGGTLTLEKSDGVWHASVRGSWIT